MTVIDFTFYLAIFSFIAGILGALTGLGGGVIIIPVLVLIFHIDIHFAMGASLISVIAISSSSGAGYLKKGYTNVRLGIFLETAAVVGAIIGALLIAEMPKHQLMILFSVILFLSSYFNIKRSPLHSQSTLSHFWAKHLQLNGTYPVNQEPTPYLVQHVPLGLGLMTIAGMLSGLLGIGAGTFKVLIMDQVLCLPYKVATTTSNFMIGITAAVSAGIYFSHGYIQPIITAPVLIGVTAGSLIGARLLLSINTRLLRILFSLLICLIACQMLYNALTEIT